MSANSAHDPELYYLDHKYSSDQFRDERNNVLNYSVLVVWS